MMLYVVLHIYIYYITARPWGLPGLATSVRASQDDDDDGDDDDFYYYYHDFDIF